MIERDALRAVLAHRSAAFLFAFVLLAIAAGGAACLWIPDSTGWALAASALAWVAFTSGLLLWCALTVVYYQRVHEGADTSLRQALALSLARLPALWLWLAAAAALGWAVSRWSYSAWAPVAILPWLGAVAARGIAGFTRPRVIRLLPVLAFLAIVGIFVPGWLWGTRPSVEGLALESLSLALRFLLAFSLAMLAWLTCASTIGRLHADRP